ncbi:MAG: RNA 2'-phosphotransferase, partial [Pseudomonadota bacterium]
MEKRLTQISKFLSLVLRHKPQSIGLTLDAEGWAEIDALIANAEMPLTRAQIDALVETNDKKRFAISSDGRLIRAVQGHSIEVDLGLAPVAPPDTLFHGMATTTRDAILREGLRPMGRRYVHLS